MLCQLHVKRWGESGPIVVGLHSSGLSGFQWKRLADKVSGKIRLLAPDFLGCGQSPPSPHGLDFRYAEDLDQVLTLLDSLGESVILLGHSYGGFIALKATLARPSKVTALALYEPVVWGGLASFRGLPIEKIVARFDPEGYLLNREMAGRPEWMERFIDYWNGSGSWSALGESARRPMLAAAEKLYAEVREVVTDSTPHTEYQPIGQPVLLLHGTTSPPEVLEMKDILAQTLANASTACIPGGHMNPVRNPLPVNAHFELFLKRTLDPMV